MSEMTIRLAVALSRACSEKEFIGMLVTAPVLSPPELTRVARNPERYGIPEADAGALRALVPNLVQVLRAMTGQRDPNLPARLYGLLGQAYRVQSRFGDAKRFYGFCFLNAASKMEKAAAYNSLSLLEEAQGHLDAAIAYLQQAKDQCETAGGSAGTTLGSILLNLGRIKKETGQLKQATDDFEQAATLAYATSDMKTFAKARMSQADLANEAGDAVLATQYLDEISWIETSGPPLAEEFVRLRAKVMGLMFVVPAAYQSHNLEGWQRVLVKDQDPRALLSLGSQYYERAEGARFENLEAAAKYWEQFLNLPEVVGGEGSKPQRDQLTDEDEDRLLLIQIHSSLGRVYNELSALGDAYGMSVKARRHYEIALELLPDRPSFVEMQINLLNDGANSLASEGFSDPAFLALDSINRPALLRSLTMQAKALSMIGEDKNRRCGFLLNMADTYYRLIQFQSAVDTYAAAADECIHHAEGALRTLSAPPADLQMGVAFAKARLANALCRPAAELIERESELTALLTDAKRKEAGPRHTTRIIIMSAALLTALGQHARSYRRLLHGMQWMLIRDTGPGAETVISADDLTRLQAHAVRAMAACGQSERMAFFAGVTLPYLGRLYPSGKGWRTREGQTVVMFVQITENQVLAILIGASGMSTRELPLSARRLIHMGSDLLAITRAAPAGQDIQEPNGKQRVGLDYVGETVGTMLFQPIEDLLPDDATLTVLSPIWMPEMPMHLARLRKVPYLLDRFDVTFSSQLDFCDPAPVIDARVAEDGIFIASFSPLNGRLLYSVLESRAVASHYAKKQLLFEAAATSAAVLDGLKKFRFAHLCCHGSYNWGSPLDSKLVFAGGVLSLRDVQLTLLESPCDVIVLSACEIGASRFGRDNSEGFVPMLLRAGCKTVIAADWRVNDLSTAVLMESLHRNLSQGETPSRALAEAQRVLRTRSAASIVEQVRGWLSVGGADLIASEAALIQEALAKLELLGNKYVFVDPVYWAAFTVNINSFAVIRNKPRSP